MSIFKTTEEVLKQFPQVATTSRMALSRPPQPSAKAVHDMFTRGSASQNHKSQASALDKAIVDQQSLRQPAMSRGVALPLGLKNIPSLVEPLTPRPLAAPSGVAPQSSASMSRVNRKLHPFDDPTVQPALRDSKTGKGFPVGTTYARTSIRNLWRGDGPRPTDFRQGLIHDCWLAAVLQNLAWHDPAWLSDLITPKGEGVYVVRLWDRHHNQKSIWVDATLLPHSSDGPIAMGLGASLGGAIFEKAAAKLMTEDTSHHGYGALDVGLITTAKQMLLGRMNFCTQGWMEIDGPMSHRIEEIHQALCASHAQRWGAYYAYPDSLQPPPPPLEAAHGYAIQRYDAAARLLHLSDPSRPLPTIEMPLQVLLASSAGVFYT